ncbi:MAG: chromate efflux transporter [Thermogutta sp.]
MLSRLWQVFWMFTQIGLASFGGPAASIALMQRAIVDRRQWVTQSEFLDFVAASHIIPGPIAVQLSLHLGYRRAGLLGAIIAVVGFVVPAATITWAIAIFYQRNQGLPEVEATLRGIRPAVLAIIVVSLWQLATKLTWNKTRLVLLTAAVGLSLLGIDAFIVMVWTLAFSGIYLVARAVRARQQKGRHGQTPPPGTSGKLPDKMLASFLAPSLAMFSQASIWTKSLYLFGMFFKIGCLLYGGGNVLAAYIQSDFVHRGLLSHAQFLDALAVGQSTPGPVLTVSTFVGYLLASHWGALSATLGIITPCVLVATVAHKFVAKARNYESAAALLNMVNVVVVGLILSVCINLGVRVFQDFVAIGIAVIAGGLLLVFDFPPILVIIGAAILGWLL